MFSLVFKIGKKSSPLAVKLSTVFKSLHLPRWVTQAGETLASQFTSSISALTCPRSPLRLCQIFAFQQVHLRDSLSPLPPQLISETPGTTLSGGPSHHAATACPNKDGRSRKAQETFSLSLLYPSSQAPLASLYPPSSWGSGLICVFLHSDSHFYLRPWFPRSSYGERSNELGLKYWLCHHPMRGSDHAPEPVFLTFKIGVMGAPAGSVG